MKSYRCPLRACLAALLSLLTLLVVVACGGGGTGDTAGGVGSGGTGSFRAGPVSGFGSILVGGVHYDETGATVADDDGQTLQGSDLRLGMVVEVEGGAVDAATLRAEARRIHVRREIVGAVSAVDTVNGALTVVGLRVETTAATVFGADYPLGLASVQPSQFVAVYGYQDAAGGRYVATRIDRLANAATWRVRGTATAVNLAGRSLSIGGQVFVWNAGVSAPAGLVDGQVVALRVQSALGGPWLVLAFGGEQAEVDADDAHLEGRITRLMRVGSVITEMAVDGRPVVASGAQLVENTLAAVGAYAEVEGALRDGVLVARRIEIETEQEVEGQELEVKGNYTGTLDTVARTFTLVNGSRTTVIGYGGVAGFAPATLQTGGCVEVHGRPGAGAVQVDATEIEAHGSACGN